MSGLANGAPWTFIINRTVCVKMCAIKHVRVPIKVSGLDFYLFLFCLNSSVLVIVFKFTNIEY